MIIGGGDGGEADFNPRPARTSGATYYIAITRAMELSFTAKPSTNYQPVVNPG
jgi:hypothetical protein